MFVLFDTTTIPSHSALHNIILHPSSEQKQSSLYLDMKLHIIVFVPTIECRVTIIHSNRSKYASLLYNSITNQENTHEQYQYQ